MTAGAAASAPASAPAAPAARLLSGAEARKVIAVAALAALADWLFWLHPAGVSLAVFAAALGTSALVCHGMRTTLRRRVAAAVLLTAALLPLVAQTSVLSIFIAVAAVAYFAIEMAAPAALRASDRLENALNVFLNCGWRAVSDVYAWAARSTQAMPRIATSLMAWVVPLVCGAVFTLLLAGANPIIEHALSVLDPARLLGSVDGMRTAFWLLVASAVWPFLFVRIKRLKRQPPVLATARPATPSGLASRLFSRAAILRSLLLFNALFAVETVLDATYLWGGAALPEGMSYAEYAHRGAYPLIVTALLAAAFVIAATAPGSAARRSALIRWLVYLWIAQNVLLVASSLLRLDLYVGVYSLTYWRVAAFIWMVLVALGLVLIMLQIATRRSGAWLIGANLVSLATTLYLCSLVSFARVIADFNVAHSLEVSGEGLPLDTGYLVRLGPQAIPALDRLIAKKPATAHHAGWHAKRNALAAAHRQRLGDWRAWTYWDGDVAGYLEQNPDAPAPPAASNPTP